MKILDLCLRATKTPEVVASSAPAGGRLLLAQRSGRVLTPPLAARASVCRHLWHLECHGDPDLKDEPDAGTRLRWDRGNQREQELVESMDDCALSGLGEGGVSWEESRRKTLELMREGAAWIYQPVLETARWRGVPDLIQRRDSHSALGDFTYMPIDIKNHKAVTKKDSLQLAAYSVLLDPVLGHRPPIGGIWLNTGEVEEVDLVTPRSMCQGRAIPAPTASTAVMFNSLNCPRFPLDW